MKNEVLIQEIDLLLKRIQVRSSKLISYGSDVPDGFVELMQQESIQLYKKLVQLEYSLTQAVEPEIRPQVPQPQVPRPEIPQPTPQPQPQPEPVPQPVPVPQPIPSPIPSPEPTPIPEPQVEPQAQPLSVPVQSTDDILSRLESKLQEKEENSSILDMVRSALSGASESRNTPFQTEMPKQEMNIPVVDNKPVENEIVPVMKSAAVVDDVRAELQNLQSRMSTTPSIKPTSSLNSEEIELPLTLADRLRMQGVADLKTAIPIADKFLFMNELFKGEIEFYNRALDKLNACQNALEARDLFESMKQHFEWDENSKTVKKFADLLTRKFL